ncbi:hypothetical protein HPB48_022569 [Haemaphysalis longicornis]|uniref:Amidase domain-containing protein n=1 Tax=Haemaphysalis longicornis TaxID=44386 RepID=A0A9J6H4R9_HAELO|nr:hypothetical protein HPB48_022569 [Haemaphysalis longicornis]
MAVRYHAGLRSHSRRSLLHASGLESGPGRHADAGSPDWKGHRPDEDAPSVARLREAGAIPLVLTNVPELCMWGDAQNMLYGTTRNPHDTRRSPGGSSGGEGSLIAAAGSLMGLGTDIAGSVRIPAAYCGIFGHKATSGIVPNSGLLPDVGDGMRQYVCVGPMTRFSEDLPLLLNVLVDRENSGLRLNEEVNLESLKLFFTETEGCRYFSRVTNEAQQAVKKVTRHFHDTHGLQTHRLQIPELQYVAITFNKVFTATDPERLVQLFSPGSRNTFVEMLRLLIGRGRHTLPVLLASKTATWFPFASPKEASKFLAKLERIRDRFEETLGDDGVLILPAATSVAPFHNQDLLFIDAPSMTALFSIFKVPATVCPVTMQKTQNGTRLPLAVQVVAKRGNDRLCLAVAREIERTFGGCLVPGAMGRSIGRFHRGHRLRSAVRNILRCNLGSLLIRGGKRRPHVLPVTADMLFLLTGVLEDLRPGGSDRRTHAAPLSRLRWALRHEGLLALAGAT